MKKNSILVILSSPRKGNSTYAAKKFAKSLKGKKIFADINILDIHPCTACGKCTEKFTCVYDDDAAALIKQAEEAGLVIVAAPVYFTGVPAPLKAFIDRNQVQWEKYRGSGFRVQVPNKPETRNLKPEPKTGVIILTAGHNKAKYFRPAESEIRSFFAVNNIKTELVMKIGNMDKKKAMKKNSAKIKAAAKKLKYG
jgi:multimeric flavodoxin WrbA